MSTSNGNADRHAVLLGVYSATKSATHTISETLRLELKPLGVKVVTVVTGSIGTNIFNNAQIDPLPETSHYKAAEKEFDTRSKGTDVAKHSDVNEFAKDLVGDVIGGVSGKVYRGAMSSMIHYATSCLPTGVTVGSIFTSSKDTEVSRTGFFSGCVPTFALITPTIHARFD